MSSKTYILICGVRTNLIIKKEYNGRVIVAKKRSFFGIQICFEYVNKLFEHVLRLTHFLTTQRSYFLSEFLNVLRFANKKTECFRNCRRIARTTNKFYRNNKSSRIK